MDAEEKPSGTTDNLDEQQSTPVRNESPVSSSSPDDSTIVVSSRRVENRVVSVTETFNNRTLYAPPIYNEMNNHFYYGGYNHFGEWEEMPRFVNTEGLEYAPQGNYYDNSRLMGNTGFGYNSSLRYPPFSHLPSIMGDPYLYPHQQYSFPGPNGFRPMVPRSVPYPAPTPITRIDLPARVTPDNRVDAIPFRPRLSYSVAPGSFPTGSQPPDSGAVPVNDATQGSNGFRHSQPESEFTRFPDRQGSLPQLEAPVSQPISTSGSLPNFQTATPIEQPCRCGEATPSEQACRCGEATPSKQPCRCGEATPSKQPCECRVSATPSDKNSLHHCSGQDCGGSSSVSCLCSNNQGFRTSESNRRNGRGRGPNYNNGALDFYLKLNRGPRALHYRSQITYELNKTFGGKYNNPNFATVYDDAMFFVIKSYSENDVHQSIKYDVWTSTTNGNRKLNCAYKNSRQRQANCPVFLLFSVNGSAQFCGVAEMTGPVDFDRSKDYWMQDKWLGHFPVIWHLVKDVPNSCFRHILLKNNENIPVTNSRDTQEVPLGQGVEILNIFKSHHYRTAILDDYDHYERMWQRQLEERRAAAAAAARASEDGSPPPPPPPPVGPTAPPADTVAQLSKSFAEVVMADGPRGGETSSTTLPEADRPPAVEAGGTAPPATDRPRDGEPSGTAPPDSDRLEAPSAQPSVVV